MSTATVDVATAPKAGGKKKLLILVLVAVLVLAAGGIGAVLLLKKKAAAAAEEDAEGAEPKAALQHRDPKAVPTFVPLDMFTVNLADRETERYAQIGIVLELDDAKVGDQIKAYMPAIRNNILMVLAHKTSKELLGREGKELLAFEVKREASRALGIEIDEEPPVVAPAKAAEGEAEAAPQAAAQPKPKAKKRKKAAEPSPIRQVQFSNFIIQ